jgi:general secretion pathway protein D
MNNFSIINVDSVYRIVPSNTNKKEPLPLYSSRQGTKPEDLPDSDMVVRYVYVLSNMSTAAAQRILTDLLGPGKVQSNKDLATCIITDKCYNIKYAMKIIKELDKGGLREAIKIIKLRYTEANEVALLFTKSIMEGQPRRTPLRIFGPREQKEITYFSNTTKIIPEKRQNSLILLGLEQNINRVIAFIRKYIDVPMDNAESRIHIKELKYVNAKNIQPIIVKMTTPPKGRGKSPLVGEFKFFEDVKVHAEDPTVGKEKKSRGSGNRLIIACNKDDWLRLEKLIDKLDKPQPQVALEVMIVDIDGTTYRNLGTQIREKTGKKLLKGMTPFTANLQAITVDTSPDTAPADQKAYNPDLGIVAAGPQGTTSITAGRQGDIWMVIKSFLSKTGTNIIEQPFMVTSNNKECAQILKTTKRVPGKLVTEGEAQYRKIEEIAAKTEIKLTPRINVGGLVDLQIEVDLSEFSGTGASDTPDRTERKLETRISVGTGEVIVLGGLTKGQVIDTTYKTPFFGDIPILGNLFKSKNKQRVKTNLYIFIRPSIIKPQFDGGPDDYTRLKLDYAKYQIFNVEGLRRTKDPIQRWFFKPEKQTVAQRIADVKAGVHRPIDNYAEGKYQPKSVRIQRDPYYRTSEAIEKLKKREEEERKKRAAFKKRKKYLLPSLRRRS